MKDVQNGHGGYLGGRHVQGDGNKEVLSSKSDSATDLLHDLSLPIGKTGMFNSCTREIQGLKVSNCSTSGMCK